MYHVNTRSSKTLSSVFMLVVILTLSISALYLAKTFLIPIIVGAFIALLCGPLVNYLVRLGVPRMVNVLTVLIGLIGIVVLTLDVLTEPAQQWWSKLPVLIENVSNEVNSATQNGNQGSSSEANVGSALANGELTNSTAFSIIKSVLTTTPTIVTQLMIALFMAYFMMMYGRAIFARSLTFFEHFSDQRKAVELVKTVQKDLSLYIGSITLINVSLGLTVGCVFYVLGLQDPFLWGAFAGALNYIPYLGPMVSVTCFALVSYLQFESLSYALTVCAIFLTINLVESQVVTPTLLGKRFSLNPLVLFVWLMFWGWLWGVMGMLIGVPLLVCINVMLERLDYFGAHYAILRAK